MTKEERKRMWGILGSIFAGIGIVLITVVYSAGGMAETLDRNTKMVDALAKEFIQYRESSRVELKEIKMEVKAMKRR